MRRRNCWGRNRMTLRLSMTLAMEAKRNEALVVPCPASFSADMAQQGDLRLAVDPFRLDGIALDLDLLVACGLQAGPAVGSQADACQRALAEAGAVGRIEQGEVVGAAREGFGGLRP